ncbi:MAG: D-glycero-beta-D-manno-heptose 1-phosphate adenylyltransferase [Dehalococcoidia bacterium]
MTADFTGLLERIASLTVLVVGDAILDSYLHGRSTRLSREAPAPVVDLDARVDAPGGAANAAASVCALGARTMLLSAFGSDDGGDRLTTALEGCGVDTSQSLRIAARATLTKQRVVVPPQVLVRLDAGTTAPLDDRAEAELVRRLQRLVPAVDAVIVSDYGYGVLSDRVIAALAALQRAAPRTLIVDAKDLPRYRDARVTAAKPNFEEARALLGGRLESTLPRIEAVVERRRDLLELTGAERLAVTADIDGALLVERDGSWHRTYARPAPNSRAAGAGDTFAAALTLGLAAGASPPVAMELASAAAQVVVTRDGTTTCSLGELRSALHGGPKVVDAEDVAAAIAAHRAAGRRIVFTNGCFDIVHRGHVTYLSQAKAEGDVLVVGLNSDASTRRLKGPGRPVNTFEDRAQVVAALSCVDHVVGFEDDTPEQLLRLIAPDVVVKGGDYTRETLPEAAFIESLGGEVRFMPYLDGTSTTRLIEQIRSYAEAS